MGERGKYLGLQIFSNPNIFCLEVLNGRGCSAAQGHFAFISIRGSSSIVYCNSDFSAGPVSLSV